MITTISVRTLTGRRLVFALLGLLALATSARHGAAQPKTRFSDGLDTADVEAIRRDLQAGADPNERYGDRGQSALERVGEMTLLNRQNKVTTEEENRIIAAFDILFEAGARLRAWDRTILHGPSIAGAALVTKYLLERGADPNGADGDGYTPMLLAVKYAQPEIIQTLLAAGATPLSPTVEAQVRLVVAADKGDLIALRKQLARGANVNEPTPTGETALVAAIRGSMLKGGNLLMVRELLRLGANANLPGRFIGPTSPLHAAVFSNEKSFESGNGPAIVAELLKAGARVSGTDSYQHQTPLHIAAQLNNAKAVALLLKAGAKVMPRDDAGKTPLDLAEAAPVIQLLKAAGATER
jgi:ankyrin repeat protein